MDEVTNVVFDSYQPVSEEQIMKLAAKLSSASCELDPISSNILKSCIGPLSPILSNTTVTVKPLLKKPDMETGQLKNYSPKSHLANAVQDH